MNTRIVSSKTTCFVGQGLELYNHAGVENDNNILTFFWYYYQYGYILKNNGEVKKLANIANLNWSFTAKWNWRF